jgi:hypothetical protein
MYLVDSIFDESFIKLNVCRSLQVDTSHLYPKPSMALSYRRRTYNLHRSFFLLPIPDNQALGYSTDLDNIVTNSYALVTNARHFYAYP